MAKAISAQWFDHLNTLPDKKKEEEKQKLKKEIGMSKDVLQVLSSIIIKKVNALDKQASDYDTPNWAFKQADLVGAKRELENILKLIGTYDQ